MNDTNNQPVPNGVPRPVSPIDQTPSSPPPAAGAPTVTKVPADPPQRDQQSTERRLAAAPATSDQALASLQSGSIAAPTASQPAEGSDRAPVPQATQTPSNTAPSQPLVASLNSVPPRAPDIGPTLDRPSSSLSRAPVSAPPQLIADAEAVPPAQIPAAVTVPSAAVPAPDGTRKAPVYSDEDLDRLAQATIAARPGFPDLEEVRALRHLIDRMLQRGLTLTEIHGILVSQHGLKLTYKRFLALLTKVKKRSA